MGNVTKKRFGQTAGGKEVFAFRLEGSGGAYVEALDYGALWKTARVPDMNGRLTDVCLSYDTIEGYEKDPMYIGVSVGRFANRIGGAAFELNGKTYKLGNNDGSHSLHGGHDGYGKRVWEHEEKDGSVSFKLHSPDGDQGYPGNLDVTVTYAFDEENALTIDYTAVCDKDTPVNLTNHAYFNLAGADSGKDGAMGQILHLSAGAITEVDGGFIPTGRIIPVDGTPLDFRQGNTIGSRLDANHPQMSIAGGYDLNFVVDGEGLREAALLACPQNGISMRLLSTKPGIQLYSGNMIGAPFERHGAVCLEPQHYPDCVNHPHFPSCILKAGETYAQRTVYEFGSAAE